MMIFNFSTSFGEVPKSFRWVWGFVALVFGVFAGGLWVEMAPD